ncbi:MAG: iron-sulfur cluster assembly accessory protein [Rhodobacteraceae bacterium]|jgi:iron-sulfur cluster assembly accessory protein|nr:iron-sulfur cluster assembly accessory protein [Paracoccaceae bacterium]
MTSETTVAETQANGAVSVASASGDSVTVSPSAIRRIARILSGEPAGTMLRISVEGGGCSGFQYKYDLVTDREDDDVVIEEAGAIVLVDPVSLQYMSGSVVDYVDDIMGQSFQINNPLASAGCGCGTSFSI